MTINISIENHSATAILPSDFCHPQIANERFYGGKVDTLNGKIGLKFYNYGDGERANLFLGAERFPEIVPIIDQLNAAAEKSREEFRKEFAAEIAQAAAEDLKNKTQKQFGYCNKCGSYCYGDCSY